MRTLIRGGTVVSPTGPQPADVLIDGETIAAVCAPEVAAELTARRGDRRDRQVRDPRRRRRAHPHADAVRRHHRERHVRDRHHRGGLGRHDDDHRLRHPAHRRGGAGRAGRLARQGGRRLRHRLRLPHDPRRRGRRRRSRRWTTSSTTRASPASSCSWPTPASSTATTGRSCGPCSRPRATARSS